MVFCAYTILPTLVLTLCLMVLYHATSILTGGVTAIILLILFIVIIPEFFNERDHSDCLRGCFFFSLLLLGTSLGCCVVIVVLQYGYSTIICMFKECCTDSWIAPNMTGLSVLLHEKVFGQHIATGVVVKLLRGHLENKPQKPLVLSLHGLSGTGKNYVTRMVVENMYVEGTKSKHVHFISAPNDFHIDRNLEDYKEHLKTRIESAVTQCPRSFFIFDKMDKIPHGLVDVLQPFLDYTDHVDGVDYRQSMFFFQSNTGDNEIANYVLKSKSEGTSRMQLSHMELERVIRTAAFDKTNGFYQSPLISSNLVSAYVPFLPLERTHVKQCIMEEMITNDVCKYDHQIDKDEVDIIDDQIEYFPPGRELFSKSGCKGVSEKVKLFARDD